MPHYSRKRVYGDLNIPQPICEDCGTGIELPSSGVRRRCAACRDARKRAYGKRTRWKQMLWEKYRMTPGDYATILAEQEGACAICRGGPNGRGRINNRFAVDHDHATGHVRGLLCSFCNSALGYIEDDPIRLERAIKYLQQGPVDIAFERSDERN
jgi:hypothetical protein